MTRTDPKDKSRTGGDKRLSQLKKNTRPPSDQGGWMAITREFLESPARRSLSINARKALDRLQIEHIGHGRMKNGLLIVTHDQFYEFGVTFENIADAVDELEYKGLIKIERGRAATGTPHASLYTLTFDGTHDGAPASDEWKNFTMAEAKLWAEVIRKQRAEQRAKSAQKKNSSLRKPVAAPLRKSVGLT